MKYLLLFATFALLIAGCANTSSNSNQSTQQTSLIKNSMGHANLANGEISPEELNQKLKDLKAGKTNPFILLDVREQEEYNEAHIPGTTTLISVKNISEETLKQNGLNPEDEIIVYCRSGHRSHIAAETIRSLGYKNVREVNSGIIHWMEDGFPTESGSGLTKLTQQTSVQTQSENTQAENAQISFDRESHDFGEVKQFGGTVQTAFKVKNNGKKNLEIGEITTSCSCTSTKIDTKTIKPGEETTLTVIFNPNLHEEPKEKFKRTIFIPTNDPKNPEAELNIWVDILEGK